MDMSTADHPHVDGQSERVNHIIEDILRSICANMTKRWRSFLPLVEFALNNSMHGSTGYTPFYVSDFTHPLVPSTLYEVVQELVGERLSIGLLYSSLRR